MALLKITSVLGEGTRYSVFQTTLALDPKQCLLGILDNVMQDAFMLEAFSSSFLGAEDHSHMLEV